MLTQDYTRKSVINRDIIPEATWPNFFIHNRRKIEPFSFAGSPTSEDKKWKQSNRTEGPRFCENPAHKNRGGKS